MLCSRESVDDKDVARQAFLVRNCPSHFVQHRLRLAALQARNEPSPFQCSHPFPPSSLVGNLRQFVCTGGRSATTCPDARSTNQAAHFSRGTPKARLRSTAAWISGRFRDLGRLAIREGGDHSSGEYWLRRTALRSARVQVDDLAFTNRLHRLPQPIEVRNVCRKCIAGHPNDDKAHRDRTQVDLMFEFAVDSNEDVKAALRKGDERAVFSASPAGFGHGGNRMSRKRSTHAGVNTFV